MSTSSRILRPKLRPPRIGSERRERQRLLDRLDQGLAGPLTLIAAPAGYGKTTLLIQWIARQDRPSAWVTLDKTDNDPSLFLEEIVEAVRLVFPDSCRDTSVLLRRPGLPSLALLTRELTNELDELDEFILVLDDCHNLKDPQTLEVLRQLVSRPPGSMHLVLACRADPLLPLGALRGRGLLNELRAAELRFSREEALEYLEHAVGRPLTEAQLASLVERTEGWIAGLHLAALSLLNREDLDEGIRAFAGSDRFVADYLMDELWAQLHPSVRYYLMATSILERLSAPLCRAVLGDEAVDSFEGRPMLEWLEDSNLFTASLDEQREWFRYHRLFGDLLRRSLHESMSPEAVAALNIRAAEFLGSHERIDDALAHLRSADEIDRAADLIEEQRLGALEAERWRALERWAGALGPEVVGARPALVMIPAWLAHQRADFTEMCGHCDRAEELLNAGERPDGKDQALRGEIAALRAHAAYWRADGAETLVLSREALARLPEDHRLARATATLFEGAGLHLLGRNQEALSVFRQGSAGYRGEAFHPRAMIGSALVAMAVGDVDYAEEVANSFLVRATDRGLGESTGWAHYFLGLAAYLRDDLFLAEKHYATVDPYVSHAVPARQSAYGLAWVRQAQGRPTEALASLDEAAAIVSSLNIPSGPEVRLLRARIAALNGSNDNGAVLARSLLPSGGPGPIHLNTCHELSAISAVAVLLMQGSDDDLAACRVALERLLSSVEATGNVFRHVQCLVLQALLLDRQSHNGEALTSLAQAVALAKPGRLIRLFPEMGDRVRGLLRALRARGDEDGFLEELLVSFESRGVASAPAPSHQPALPRQEYLIETLLTNRELDVLELLDQRLSNKEIAKTLFISPATVKRHTLSIYSKLGVTGRREAAVRARHLGLLSTQR